MSDSLAECAVYFAMFLYELQLEGAACKVETLEWCFSCCCCYYFYPCGLFLACCKYLSDITKPLLSQIFFYPLSFNSKTTCFYNSVLFQTYRWFFFFYNTVFMPVVFLLRMATFHSQITYLKSLVHAAPAVRLNKSLD